MESDTDKITNEQIYKACLDGFIVYLETNSESIWIRGEKTQIVEVRKKIDDMYPEIKPMCEIGDTVQELLVDGTTTIMFNSSCSVFKTTDKDSGESVRIDVKSNQSEGSLILLKDNSLKFEIKRIDFSMKN